jgi:release factor glutamine methyltransferase
VSGGLLDLTIRRARAQSGLVPVDARVLMQHVLGVDRAWLLAHDDETLTDAQAATFFALAKRRRDGEPVAYLVGRREFMGLDFAVTPAVLIPRPETETVVELALAVLPFDRAIRVLDMGTGSGAIALAIAHDRPLAHVVATDVSDAALALARDNASRLGLRNVTFAHADLYAIADSHEAGPYDMIVSNPPYVAALDPHLGEGDLRYEPVTALAAGPEGLDVLRPLIGGAPSQLAPGGHLVVEHGHDQAAAVRALFDSAGFAEVVSVRDLAGIPRAMRGRLA